MEWEWGTEFAFLEKIKQFCSPLHMEAASPRPTVAACHNDSLEEFYAKKRES